LVLKIYLKKRVATAGQFPFGERGEAAGGDAGEEPFFGATEREGEPSVKFVFREVNSLIRLKLILQRN